MRRHGLPEIMRAFKSFSARRVNEYLGTMGHPLWQRNYFEHVIRDEKEWDRIRQYVESNPLRWEQDHENPAYQASTNREAS
jgi:REP element-mobilizing transposase RayT